MAAPSPTPVPIEDIVGPVPYFPYPIWMVVVAALALLALLAGLVWWVVFRPKKQRPLTPWEIAIAELTALRAQADVTEPYAFAIQVSDVLRDYLTAGLGLPAVNQTSLEFLETVRQRQTFQDEERTALAAFLEKADLIKFARVHATAADAHALVEQAERLVRSRTPLEVNP